MKGSSLLYKNRREHLTNVIRNEEDGDSEDDIEITQVNVNVDDDGLNESIAESFAESIAEK